MGFCGLRKTVRGSLTGIFTFTWRLAFLMVLTGCALKVTDWGPRIGWTKPGGGFRPSSPVPPQLSGQWTITQLTLALQRSTGLDPVVDDADQVELVDAPLSWESLLASMRRAGWLATAGGWRFADVPHGHTMLPRRQVVFQWRLTQGSAGTDFGSITASASLAQGQIVCPDGVSANQSSTSTRTINSPIFSGVSGTAIATTQATASAGLSANVRVEWLDNDSFRVSGNMTDSAFTGSSGSDTTSANLPFDLDVPSARWLPVGSISDLASGVAFVPWTATANLSGSTAILWIRVDPL